MRVKKNFNDKAAIELYFKACKDYRGISNDAGLPDEILSHIDQYRVIRPRDIEADLLNELFIDCCREIEPRFVVDEDNQDAIKKITNHIQTTGKGILLSGPVGTGKTVLMKGLNQLLYRFNCRYHSYKINFYNLPVYKIASGFAAEGFKIFEDGICGDGMMIDGGRMMIPLADVNVPLLLDDIGVNDVVSHFGNTVNIVSEIIMRRYDRGARTYITTNMSIKTLQEHYGERVYSRMKEMFMPYYVKGPDRRNNAAAMLLQPL